MGLFDKIKYKDSFMDEIRCDEPSYLIWKWHPSGSQAGKNNRENAIRWGSSLRVKEGEVAVFVYQQENGTVQDFIAGPFDQILETDNLPVIASIFGLAYGGGTPFPAEVYFINLAKIIQVKFGVPFFDIFDPRFTDFSVPVAVRGTINFSIADYCEFIKLHRLSTFSLEDFQREIRDAVCRYVKDVVANAPAVHNIPVVQIESKISQINDVVEYNLSERLKESFGVNLSGIDIGAIEIDKSSDGYRQLMSVTRDISVSMAKAEAENYEESLRIQREESQYAQRKSTQTANFAAFQLEKQAEVGIAGAEAMGQMSANGTAGTGVNMAAMMTGMAVGGAVGQNLAGTINNVMGGVNQQIAPGSVPPPVPTVTYYVAVNGQAAGPFDISALTQMATSGQLTADSLVWKNGMAEWVKAGAVNELKSLLENCIPPVPNKNE